MLNCLIVAQTTDQKKVYEGTQLRKVTEGTLDAVVSLEHALAWLLGPKGLYRTSAWAQSKTLYRISQG